METSHKRDAWRSSRALCSAAGLRCSINMAINAAWWCRLTHWFHMHNSNDTMCLQLPYRRGSSWQMEHREVIVCWGGGIFGGIDFFDGCSVKAKFYFFFQTMIDTKLLITWITWPFSKEQNPQLRHQYFGLNWSNGRIPGLILQNIVSLL